MKYRDHIGGLAESLETVIEVKNKRQLKKHINKDWKSWGKKVDRIKFVHVGLDSRIGWDTYYVLQRVKGEKTFTVAGMSDGKLWL